MMEEFWMAPFAEMGRWGEAFTPRVDVKEEDNHVLVCAELPGIDQKDIDVTVTHDSVRIAGEKKHEEEKEERGYYRRETSYGSFERVIELPSEIDETNRKPRRMVTMTCSSPSNPKQVEAPFPRLTMPEMIAASCSALARVRLLDMAMRSPSEDTATASVTPAVFSTNPFSSQLKLRASSLRVWWFIALPPGSWGCP